MAGSAPVEAEDELVEVGLQVLASEAVVDAQRPGLEVGEDAMNPGQDHMGGHVSDDVRVVCDAGRAGVAGPAVGPGRGAGGEVGAQEGVQAVGGEVLDPRQADPAGPTLADLDSTGDQQLALVTAPTAAARRVILGAAGDQAFVHFDQARQRHALWCDHGPAQLGGEQPCGLVGTQAELLLELQRRDPVGVRGHQIGGPEPRDQRQLGAVHHRTGRHRGLLATVGAFMGVCLGRERPPPATHTIDSILEHFL